MQTEAILGRNYNWMTIAAQPQPPLAGIPRLNTSFLREFRARTWNLNWRQEPAKIILIQVVEDRVRAQFKSMFGKFLGGKLDKRWPVWSRCVPPLVLTKRHVAGIDQGSHLRKSIGAQSFCA